MSPSASSAYFLMVRALREAARQPAVEATNIFIPLFFFAVSIGSIGQISGRAFGIENYAGFQVPVAIIQAAAGAAGSSGLGMTTDIAGGYFDKLLLTPAPRLSLVIGRMASDGVRIMVLAAIILVAGIITGAGMEAGPMGYVVIILIAGFFGLAYAGFGMAIALKTGSPQAAQAGFLLFFPLLFLSPAFAPKEIFSGWLEFLATINPVTYVIEGMRSLVLVGWDATALMNTALAIAGLGAFTFTMTLLALRGRTA